MAKHAINAGQGEEVNPIAVSSFTATDVGTNRPYLASAASSQAGAAGIGAAAQLSWVDNNNLPISSYTITSSPATYTATVTAPATSYLFEGLASNTAYTFSIVANSYA